MLVTEFTQNFTQYQDFEVWEIDGIDSFFDGNGVIPIIFESEYNMTLSEFKEKRAEIEDTDMEVMEKVLAHIADKYFMIFTLHNPNHLELIKMQMMKMINFGMDIEKLKEDHVYVMIMDKKLSGSVTMN